MTASQPRARNTDRDDARAMLDAAYASGQLTAEEHRARVASAAGASTLARLHQLVRDLQTPDDAARTRFRPQPPPSGHAPAPAAPAKRTPATRTAVIAALAGLLAFAFIAPRVLGPAGGAARESAAPTSMLSAASLGRMLDDLEREFGDLTTTKVIVYPEYATIARPIADKPGQEQNYTYEIAGGASELTERGASNRTNEAPADLAELRSHLPRVVGLLHGAGETLRVSEPASSYLILSADEFGGDGPTVQMFVTNEEQGTSGHLTVGFDGVVQGVRRSDS